MQHWILLAGTEFRALPSLAHSHQVSYSHILEAVESHVRGIGITDTDTPPSPKVVLLAAAQVRLGFVSAAFLLALAKETRPDNGMFLSWALGARYLRSSEYVRRK